MPAVSEDELRMRFDLVRQSIAEWSADTVRFVAAASRARQTDQADRETAAAASRTLSSVREEVSALSEASRAAAIGDPDLLRGIETALAELGSLDRNITEALEQMAAAVN